MRWASREYAVQDANQIVMLAKAGMIELMGIVPQSLQDKLEKLEGKAKGRTEVTLTEQ